jgi:tetratricopeptide (TPR) repeat protein
VRQYAAERLQESGETQPVRTRHRDWCIAVAAESSERGRFDAFLPTLEEEHDNFRAALAWCASDAGGAQQGMHLASQLWRFWSIRGYLSEGAEQLKQAVKREGAQDRTPMRADALIGAGTLSADYPSRRMFAEESLSIYRELGHRRGVADALNHLGQTEFATGNYALAESCYQEAISIARDLGNTSFVAWSLNNLGNAARQLGDYEKAKPLLEESLRIRRDLGVKVASR